MKVRKTDHNKLNDALLMALQNGYRVEAVDDIEHGKQITLEDRLYLNCFNTGKIQVQGQQSPQLNRLKMLMEALQPYNHG